MVEPRALGKPIPILRVAKLAASIDYYRTRLGWSVAERGVASVKRDNASIMLCEGDQGKPGPGCGSAR
jgi:catechol 2,3-dioxygenase-like lactoylglutathione lyase family enzyme